MGESRMHRAGQPPVPTVYEEGGSFGELELRILGQDLGSPAYVGATTGRLEQAPPVLFQRVRCAGKSVFWQHFQQLRAARLEALAEQRRVAQFGIRSAIAALLDSYRR